MSAEDAITENSKATFILWIDKQMWPIKAEKKMVWYCRMQRSDKLNPRRWWWRGHSKSFWSAVSSRTRFLVLASNKGDILSNVSCSTDHLLHCSFPSVSWLVVRRVNCCRSYNRSRASHWAPPFSI
jgi:hypothetical protein